MCIGHFPSCNKMNVKTKQRGTKDHMGNLHDCPCYLVVKWSISCNPQNTRAKPQNQAVPWFQMYVGLLWPFLPCALWGKGRVFKPSSWIHCQSQSQSCPLLQFMRREGVEPIKMLNPPHPPSKCESKLTLSLHYSAYVYSTLKDFLDFFRNFNRNLIQAQQVKSARSSFRENKLILFSSFISDRNPHFCTLIMFS